MELMELKNITHLPQLTHHTYWFHRLHITRTGSLMGKEKSTPRRPSGLLSPTGLLCLPRRRRPSGLPATTN